MPHRVPTSTGPHSTVHERGVIPREPTRALAALRVRDLQQLALPRLEHIWSTSPCAPLPGGTWQGTYLCELPMSAPKRFLARAMFKWRAFGLDLDANKWWFREPRRHVAAFEPVPGPSRWRDADVVQLHYEHTGPHLLKHQLYDELKPLNDHCILAIGGSNHDALRGTWFFFALSPFVVS
ncbi:MAG: hypothetical protein SFX73_01655 [Kofleriaceae bacterium]|nr:hypothetical protein [Kofleriaceae bacterium]